MCLRVCGGEAQSGGWWRHRGSELEKGFSLSPIWPQSRGLACGWRLFQGRWAGPFCRPCPLCSQAQVISLHLNAILRLLGRSGCGGLNDMFCLRPPVRVSLCTLPCSLHCCCLGQWHFRQRRASLRNAIFTHKTLLHSRRRVYFEDEKHQDWKELTGLQTVYFYGFTLKNKSL